MPIIQPQHANDPWRPELDWPSDCAVQWGRGGLVLRAPERGGPYNTAFFEAFPKAGGFIRGEGDSLVAAEQAAFYIWLRESACSRHEWSRKKYTNGGAFCRRCGAFGTPFKPIQILGDWRKPPSGTELQMIADGMLICDAGEDVTSRKWRRKLYLRSRQFGIPLPPTPDDVKNFSPEHDAYAEQCRTAVLTWLAERIRGGCGANASSSDSLQGFFEGMSFRFLLREVVSRGLASEDEVTRAQSGAQPPA